MIQKKTSLLIQLVLRQGEWSSFGLLAATRECCSQYGTRCFFEWGADEENTVLYYTTYYMTKIDVQNGGISICTRRNPGQDWLRLTAKAG